MPADRVEAFPNATDAGKALNEVEFGHLTGQVLPLPLTAKDGRLPLASPHRPPSAAPAADAVAGHPGDIIVRQASADTKSSKFVEHITSGTVCDMVSSLIPFGKPS